MVKIKNFKPNTAISRAGFIGFIIMLMITFIMEVWLETSPSVISIPTYVKFIIYIIGYGGVVILGVDKPDIKKFLNTVWDAISDGKVTAEEAINIVRSAWFVLFGFFAIASQEEEEKEKIDEL